MGVATTLGLMTAPAPCPAPRTAPPSLSLSLSPGSMPFPQNGLLSAPVSQAPCPHFPAHLSLFPQSTEGIGHCSFLGLFPQLASTPSCHLHKRGTVLAEGTLGVAQSYTWEECHGLCGMRWGRPCSLWVTFSVPANDTVDRAALTPCRAQKAQGYRFAHVPSAVSWLPFGI